MAERTIKTAYFIYRVPYLRDGEQVTDDRGRPVYLEKTAWKGDTVDIPLPADVELGETHGLFVQDAAPIGDMSAAELRRWLTDEKPSVADVAAAVGDDADLAKRVIAAEQKVAGDDARTTLLEQLDRVAGQA